MGKRRVFTAFVSFCMVLLFSVVTTFAEEDDKTNNLTLDTEILNNKKEDVNSNTTIGDVNLFTADFGQALNEEKKANSTYYDDISKSMFTSETVVKKDEKKDIKAFEKKVTFDKNVIEEMDSFNYQPIFILTVIVLMIVTYVVTRRRYVKKPKEESGNANYSNFYE